MKRPRLLLRDLFWLILVIAGALGWWLDHRRLAREAATAKDQAATAKAQATTLLNRALAAQVRVEEMKSMRNAYQARLKEFGNFTHRPVGPMEFEVVPGEAPTE